jgi:aminopeptidase N
MRIWKDRSFQIAETLVVDFYPAALANTDLQTASQAWLAANPDEPALRRLVVENLAGVDRALAAQARDAAED